MLPAELRNVHHLPGHRRRGTNIHRRHLLGHGPSWPRPYSGVSDVPRHTPVSDVPKQDTALSAGYCTDTRLRTLRPPRARWIAASHSSSVDGTSWPLLTLSLLSCAVADALVAADAFDT